ALNLQFGGWNLMAENLFVVNGEFDPWRSASLSSRAAPAFVDSPTQEITVIPNGHHCWDWTMANAIVNPDVMQTQNLGISKIRSWLADWYEAHPSIKNNLPPAPLDPEMAATLASMNDTMQRMQADLNKLRSEKGGAIASYVLNGILAAAFLVALGLFFRERSSRSPRKPVARGPLPDPQGSTARLLDSLPRQSVEQEAWRVPKYSDSF
ncbi:hypothetical protein FRC01_010076, partial [Tulasnella sp. 417]